MANVATSIPPTTLRAAVADAIYQTPGRSLHRTRLRYAL
jgi:hypothetical protein